MTRFAPATIRAREDGEVLPGPAPPRKKPAQQDDTQDRLGAQGSFQAGVPAPPMDSWTEIAQIVARLLKQQADFEPTQLPGPQSKPAPPKPEAPGNASDTSAPVAAAEKGPVPLDPAIASANDPQMRLMAGDEPEPGPTPVEVPRFPKSKQGGKPGAAAGSGGGGGGGGRPGPAGGGPGGQAPAEEAPPEFIVVQWAGSVNNAGGAMSAPKVKPPADAVADLEAKREGSVDRNGKAREGLAGEALSNVPKAPEVENPPPPPPDNPVPTHTRAILDASGKRLPDQFPPPLEPSPRIEDKAEPLTLEPKLPVIGEQAVPSDVFQVLISPKGLEMAQISAEEVKGIKDAKGRFAPKQAKDAKGKPDPEVTKMQLAYMQLSNTGEVKVPKGEGEQVISPDTGPEPMPPLPPGLEVPVGQVVARLLARADKTTKEVLDGLRTQAYAGGVLKKLFPDVGEAMLGDLSTQVDTELRDIAGAANISADQLETMIQERRAELETSATGAKKEADAAGADAVKAVQDAGQQTMDAVDGAAKAAEAETLKRQEAAGGAADPTVVNRRRDLTVNWIKTHVTEQTTNYQLAGEKRLKELTGVKKQQTQAYQALRQRLVFQIMTPAPDSGRKPREPVDNARERRLADLAAQLNPWEEDLLKRVGEMFRKAIKFVDDTTKANRKAVETAGTTGIEATRQWAEDKILEGKGFWERLLTRIRRWLSQADSLNEEWRVKRTRENRDAVAKDLQLIEQAKKRLAEGTSQEAILADKSLSDEQKDIIRQFFSGRTALDIAADRLKQKIAASHLDAARAIFERELCAVPATRDNADKLNDIVHAMGDTGFDGSKIATEVHAAMDQWGTDEGRIFRNLKGLTAFKGVVVRKWYTANGWGDLDEDLDDEMSGDELSRAQAQLDGKQALADAVALHDAIAGWGTDEKAIMDTLRNKSPEEIEAIRAEYQARYGETLDAALKGDLDEGNEIDQANALMSGDTATADAIALDEAMRGGIISSGTDEAEIDRIQTRVREEVLAQSQGKWNSQQMEAEVRRRMKAIEDRFGARYAHVEQYNEPGLAGGSVLKRAFASELSGAELDLANAQQDNDLAKADAARIEIERTGFYASDAKLLKVMRSQYERALEARRLDEEPARRMVIQREVTRLRNLDPQMSEEEISKVRMRMEREMEAAIDKGATADAKLSTDALRDAYEGKYHRNLAYTLSFNMSGREHDTALAILKNDGKLSNLQEIELATKGGDADDDMLRKTFAKMTKAEIAVARSDWERRHPGKSFDAWLRGNLSGRAESDIMDMVENGAPESAKQQIAQEERRVRREREELTGIVGEQVAGSEDETMKYHLAKLKALETELDRTNWPKGEQGQNERAALMEQVDFRVQRVQDSVEDHRRRIDSVTDSIAQVASVVAAVVVGAIVTVLTAGMAGPAAVALVALASSVAGTLATMATKRLVMGGAYGAKDFKTDLVVGVVDAVVSVATAGVGNKFMKLAKGVVGKLPVGRVASVVTKPGAMIGAALAKSPLAGTVARIGESSFATKALKTPFVGGALRHAEGSVRNVGRILSKPAEMVGATERFLARSAENVVTAIPTTVTQLGMTDQTWKGDPLANFVDGIGSGMWQAFYMGHLIAGPAEFAQKSLVHGMHMRTEVGRMHLAGEMVQEGFGAFREKNPGASVSDFLTAPEGRKVRADIDRMGLLPTIDSVNKRIASDPAVKARLAAGEPEPASSAKSQADERIAQLEAALPPTVREKAWVTPDPDLTGNTVRVEPLRIGDRVVGAEIRVGPEATPLDVAMHAATAHVMQKYAGIGGRIFQSLERFGALLAGSDVHFGKRGWEAQQEMAKLPGIIDARIKALEGQAITPELAARFQADIDSLTLQFHEHDAIMRDDLLGAQEGRGYVAAEDLAPAQKKIAKTASEQEKSGPLRDQNGDMTDLGKADLAGRLKQAKKLLREAGKLSSADYRTDADRAAIAQKSNEARQILRDAAAAYGLDYKLLTEHIITKGGHPEINERLKLGMPAPAPEPMGPPAPGRRDADQLELDKMMAELQHADPLGPSALIDKIRQGGLEGARAQELLNAQSQAPSDATLINFSTATLETAFAAAGGVPQSGREGGVRVEINGIELFLFSPKPKNDDPHRGPPPNIAFEGTLPRKVNGKTAVYQFGDGELRVWYLEPSSDNPHGRLVQEAIIGRGRERMGHEDQFRTHGEDDLGGAPTQLAHATGAGLRVESPFGISRAPYEVNQTLQAKGIEAYLRRLRDELPPGATLSYSPAITYHEGTNRPKRIDYLIEITIQGQRRPFAEFAIDVEIERVARTPRPGDEDQRKMIVKTKATTADTLTWRYPKDSPALTKLFTHLHEAVDIPQQIVVGNPTTRPRDVIMAERLGKLSSAEVATKAADVGGYDTHRPADAASFDPVAWRNDLVAMLADKDTPTYIVVDTRGLGLDQSQMAAITDAIDRLPVDQHHRVVVLR